MRRSISIDALDMSKSRHLMPNRTHITGSKNSWSVSRCVEVRSKPVSTGVAMSKTAIISPELTPPVGPFSQAIEVGGFLYFSGQVGQDPATGKMVEGGIVAETGRVFQNLAAVLKAAGR